MKRLAIAGCLGAGVMLFAGCAIPAQVTSPQPTVVITQPPSPTPSETPIGCGHRSQRHGAELVGNGCQRSRGVVSVLALHPDSCMGSVCFR